MANFHCDRRRLRAKCGRGNWGEEVYSKQSKGAIASVDPRFHKSSPVNSDVGVISAIDDHLFGNKNLQSYAGNESLMSFSARLDETGTGGESSVVTVGGAVATAEQWGELELAWEKELEQKRVSNFHLSEFPHHSDYAGWSRLKQTRFLKKLDRICERNTEFRVAIGVESAAHAEIKARMRGVKGFYPDSDYGLCLRYMMFWICEVMEAQIGDDFRLSIMVESGPYASGAADLYGRVSKMTGKWKPARHARRLNGFSMVPKGRNRSLEAADYLTGTMHADLVGGVSKRSRKLTLLLDRDLLEQWYEGMIREKELRRAYASRSKNAAESL